MEERGRARDREGEREREIDRQILRHASVLMHRDQSQLEESFCVFDHNVNNAAMCIYTRSVSSRRVLPWHVRVSSVQRNIHSVPLLHRVVPQSSGGKINLWKGLPSSVFVKSISRNVSVSSYQFYYINLVHPEHFFRHFLVRAMSKPVSDYIDFNPRCETAAKQITRMLQSEFSLPVRELSPFQMVRSVKAELCYPKSRRRTLYLLFVKACRIFCHLPVVPRLLI